MSIHNPHQNHFHIMSEMDVSLDFVVSSPMKAMLHGLGYKLSAVAACQSPNRSILGRNLRTKIPFLVKYLRLRIDYSNTSARDYSG